MKTEGLLIRSILIIILGLSLGASLEVGLAREFGGPLTAVRMAGWTIDDGNLTGYGASWAGYNESCEEGDLNLSFKLKNLTGEMRVNINIDGSNRYSIGFTNTPSLAKDAPAAFVALIPSDDYTLSTFIFKYVGETEPPEKFAGNSIPYDPTKEHQVSIISREGHIQVYIERIEAADKTVIREIDGEMMAGKISALPQVIDYADPDPLPPGIIDFETLEGAYVELYDLVLTCRPNQPPTVTSLGPDPTALRVDRGAIWTASASDPEGDPVFYCFWLRGPSTGDDWELQQNWSAEAKWEWRPSQRGVYRIGAYATDGRHSADEIFYSKGSWKDDLVYVEERPLVLGEEDSFQRPDPEELVDGTADGIDWGGKVPINHVLVVVDERFSFEEATDIAEDLAKGLNGSVVGQFETILMFQIKTNRTTARGDSIEGLIRDIATAREDPSIELAFPNQQIYRESPLSDSVYAEENCKGYEMVRVQESWDRVNESGVRLFPVKVAVIDDGIYRWENCCEFDNATINTTVGGDAFAPAVLEEPLPGFEIAGSHGTGIMNILAADPDDGGLVGIASQPLGNKLMINLYNIYPPDDNMSFSTDAFLSLKYALENGSTIISCSWGNDRANNALNVAYKKFFKNISNIAPERLFVCSAGNGGVTTRHSDYKHAPGGIEISNMITVGNVMNDRTPAPDSNQNIKDFFEVTLAAPGAQAVWGRNDSGDIKNNSGGTSMAAPHVTAAAAMMRSIYPSLEAKDMKDILRDTGDITPDDPDELVGRVLNIDGSIDNVLENLPETLKDETRAPLHVEIPRIDGVVTRHTTPKGTNWSLDLTLSDGSGEAKAELKLTQHETVISGNGNLYFLPEEDIDGSASPRSKCPRDDIFGDVAEAFLGNALPTPSQQPVEARGSFEETNLQLSIVSLNDMVRYEMTLSVIGSQITGTFKSYDGRGMARSRGVCYGSLKKEDI
jgi:hypothetical protein